MIPNTSLSLRGRSTCVIIPYASLEWRGIIIWIGKEIWNAWSRDIINHVAALWRSDAVTLGAS